MTDPTRCEYLININERVFCGRLPTHRWAPRLGKGKYYHPHVFCSKHHGCIQVFEDIYECSLITHHFPYDD
jgi:hypothetical protein